jgi:hypothetical protein
MSDAEGFRNQGFKCLGLSRGATSLPDRLRWLDLAQYWFSRADAQERAQTETVQRQHDDARIRSFHHV